MTMTMQRIHLQHESCSDISILLWRRKSPVRELRQMTNQIGFEYFHLNMNGDSRLRHKIQSKPTFGFMDVRAGPLVIAVGI